MQRKFPASIFLMHIIFTDHSDRLHCLAVHNRLTVTYRYSLSLVECSVYLPRILTLLAEEECQIPVFVIIIERHRLPILVPYSSCRIYTSNEIRPVRPKTAAYDGKKVCIYSINYLFSFHLF